MLNFNRGPRRLRARREDGKLGPNRATDRERERLVGQERVPLPNRVEWTDRFLNKGQRRKPGREIGGRKKSRGRVETTVIYSIKRAYSPSKAS